MGMMEKMTAGAETEEVVTPEKKKPFGRQ